MMATQLAEAERVDLRIVEADSVHPPVFDDEIVADDELRMTAVRGIVIAILISLPFWALIGFTIYLLS